MAAALQGFQTSALGAAGLYAILDCDSELVAATTMCQGTWHNSFLRGVLSPSLSLVLAYMVIIGVPGMGMTLIPAVLLHILLRAQLLFPTWFAAPNSAPTFARSIVLFMLACYSSMLLRALFWPHLPNTLDHFTTPLNCLYGIWCIINRVMLRKLVPSWLLTTVYSVNALAIACAAHRTSYSIQAFKSCLYWFAVHECWMVILPWIITEVCLPHLACWGAAPATTATLFKPQSKAKSTAASPKRQQSATTACSPLRTAQHSAQHSAPNSHKQCLGGQEQGPDKPQQMSTSPSSQKQLLSNHGQPHSQHTAPASTTCASLQHAVLHSPTQSARTRTRHSTLTEEPAAAGAQKQVHATAWAPVNSEPSIVPVHKAYKGQAHCQGVIAAPRILDSVSMKLQEGMDPVSAKQQGVDPVSMKQQEGVHSRPKRQPCYYVPSWMMPAQHTARSTHTEWEGQGTAVSGPSKQPSTSMWRSTALGKKVATRPPKEVSASIASQDLLGAASLGSYVRSPRCSIYIKLRTNTAADPHIGEQVVRKLQEAGFSPLGAATRPGCVAIRVDMHRDIEASMMEHTEDGLVNIIDSLLPLLQSAFGKHELARREGAMLDFMLHGLHRDMAVAAIWDNIDAAWQLYSTTPAPCGLKLGVVLQLPSVTGNCTHTGSNGGKINNSKCTQSDNSQHNVGCISSTSSGGAASNSNSCKPSTIATSGSSNKDWSPSTSKLGGSSSTASSAVHVVPVEVQLLPAEGAKQLTSEQVAAVSGWVRPQPGQHSTVGETTRMQLLASIGSHYVNTRVLEASMSEPSDAYVKLELLIPDFLLPRHHKGGPPVGVVPSVIELVQGDVTWSSTAVVLQVPWLCTMSQRTAPTAWWWGTTGRVMGRAMQQLHQATLLALEALQHLRQAAGDPRQDCSMQKASCSSSSRLPMSVETWQSMQEQLYAWLTGMQQMALHYRACPIHSAEVDARMQQPAQSNAVLDLGTISQHISNAAQMHGMTAVHRMVRQQLQSLRAWQDRAAMKTAAMQQQQQQPSSRWHTVIRALTAYSQSGGCWQCQRRAQRHARRWWAAHVQVHLSLALASYSLFSLMVATHSNTTRSALHVCIIMPWINHVTLCLPHLTHMLAGTVTRQKTITRHMHWPTRRQMCVGVYMVRMVTYVYLVCLCFCQGVRLPVGLGLATVVPGVILSALAEQVNILLYLPSQWHWLVSVTEATLLLLLGSECEGGMLTGALPVLGMLAGFLPWLVARACVACQLTTWSAPISGASSACGASDTATHVHAYASSASDEQSLACGSADMGKQPRKHCSADIIGRSSGCGLSDVAKSNATGSRLFGFKPTLSLDWPVFWSFVAPTLSILEAVICSLGLPGWPMSAMPWPMLAWSILLRVQLQYPAVFGAPNSACVFAHSLYWKMVVLYGLSLARSWLRPDLINLLDFFCGSVPKPLVFTVWNSLDRLHVRHLVPAWLINIVHCLGSLGISSSAYRASMHTWPHLGNSFLGLAGILQIWMVVLPYAITEWIAPLCMHLIGKAYNRTLGVQPSAITTKREGLKAV